MKRAKAHAFVLLTAASVLPACGLNQAGVEPPRDTIAFPASAVMDHSGDWLLVTNSNADLRYNDGTLVAFSVKRAADDRDPGKGWGDCRQISDPNPRSDTPPFCCWDLLDPDILNCDERAYVGPDDDPGNGDGNVRIGSFAAAMLLQPRECPKAPECALACFDAEHDDHLLIGVRGDTSLTYVNVQKLDPATPQGVPPRLTCSSEMGAFEVCDKDHTINKTTSALASPTPDPTSPEVTLPDEPYALAYDDVNGLLYVGHLTGNTTRPLSGGFSLFDVMPRGDAELDKPRLIAPFPSPFGPNSVGSVGITALKAHKPTDDMDRVIEEVTNIYAASRFVPQVAPLGVTADCPQDVTSIREIAAFPSGAYYSSPLAGSETRGIEFVDEDKRVFVLQRSPPALISFLNPYTPTEVLETCGNPTFLSQYNSGVGPRLFVTCTSDGEIYVYDPSVPRLVTTFLVGRGPAGLVFDDERKVAYSVNFGDNGIAVVDLAPGSPTEYHVIQRIGFPRTTPR